MAIQVRVITGTKSDGSPRVSKTFTARDGDHAQRVIERYKTNLPTGSSTYFTRHTI